MKSPFFHISLGASLLMMGILSVSAAVPSNPPAGMEAYPGGKFFRYFQNMIGTAPCAPNAILKGFDAGNTEAYGTKQCVPLPAPTDGSAFAGFNSSGTPVFTSTWLKSGTALYYNGGNVGIGTSNPQTKLDVRQSGNQTTLRVSASDGNTVATGWPAGWSGIQTWDILGSSIKLLGQAFINNQAPTIYLQDTDHRSAMIHTNQNQFYVLRGDGNNSPNWTPLPNNRWPLQIDLNNGQTTIGGGLYVDGNIKMTSQTLASDSNDTVATKGYVDAKGGGPVNFSCPAGQFVAGFGPTGAPLCRGPSYLYQWEVSAYGACSVTCGGGTQTRTIKCRRNDGYYMTDESYCNEAKPSTTNSCNTQVCLVGDCASPSMPVCFIGRKYEGYPVNLSCGAGKTITTSYAVYGSNCNGIGYGVTFQVSQMCSGKSGCNFTVNNGLFGDPFDGCRKNFQMKYECK